MHKISNFSHIPQDQFMRNWFVKKKNWVIEGKWFVKLLITVVVNTRQYLLWTSSIWFKMDTEVSWERKRFQWGKKNIAPQLCFEKANYVNKHEYCPCCEPFQWDKKKKHSSIINDNIKRRWGGRHCW